MEQNNAANAAKRADDFLDSFQLSLLEDEGMGEDIMDNNQRKTPPPPYQQQQPSARSYIATNRNFKDCLAAASSPQVMAASSPQVMAASSPQVIDVDAVVEDKGAKNFYDTFCSLLPPPPPQPCNSPNYAVQSFSPVQINTTTTTKPTSTITAEPSTTHQQTNYFHVDTNTSVAAPTLQQLLTGVAFQGTTNKTLNEITPAERLRYETIFRGLKFSQKGKHIKRCVCCTNHYKPEELIYDSPEIEILFNCMVDIDQVVKDPSHIRCFCCWIKTDAKQSLLDQ